MSIKKTQLLASELEVIAETLPSNYCREVLIESAQRLKELERIAEFYQAEASRLAERHKGRKEICNTMYQKR